MGGSKPSYAQDRDPLAPGFRNPPGDSVLNPAKSSSYGTGNAIFGGGNVASALRSSQNPLPAETTTTAFSASKFSLPNSQTVGGGSRQAPPPMAIDGREFFKKARSQLPYDKVSQPFGVSLLTQNSSVYPIVAQRQGIQQSGAEPPQYSQRRRQSHTERLP